jgi:hypothetical protein
MEEGEGQRGGGPGAAVDGRHRYRVLLALA